MSPMYLKQIHMFLNCREDSFPEYASSFSLATRLSFTSLRDYEASFPDVTQ
jgi:hypothetical protein